MVKYGKVCTMITKRQRKKRGKKDGGQRKPVRREKRELGFEVGKWVQVYAQKERVTYWIKVDKIERVRDEDLVFSS